VPSVMRSGSQSLKYIDLMSALVSRLLFVSLLIPELRLAVIEERRGGQPARLVGVGVACREGGFLSISELVEAGLE
jgi:hypothetical protein